MRYIFVDRKKTQWMVKSLYELTKFVNVLYLLWVLSSSNVV